MLPFPIIGDTTAHPQKVIYGDSVGVWKVGIPFRQRIRFVEFPFINQLQNGRCHKRFGDAAYTELIVRVRRSSGVEVCLTLGGKVFAFSRDRYSDQNSGEVFIVHNSSDGSIQLLKVGSRKALFSAACVLRWLGRGLLLLFCAASSPATSAQH